MALELVAFRLYAPYFGYSIYVWGSMISVVMVALAGGYALGGFVADRSRTDRPLYWVILVSAGHQAVMIWTAATFLPALARAGEFTGPAVATAIIFAPPMTALATVGPFVIRLLAHAGHVGVTAGTVYALSTLGSVVGVLTSSFWLVPRFGTRVTLVVLCATSIVLGAAGLATRKVAVLLAVGLMASLALAPAIPQSAETLWAGESAYNFVHVVSRDQRLLLVLNELSSVHTIQDVATGWTGRYYDDFAVGPLLVRARRALVLGMGAGGSIASMRAAARNVEIDAVEIDPVVIDAGARFFGLRADDHLRVHVADARPWLARGETRYDLVQVDLYHGGPYVPFYLFTVEFFRLVRARLADDGVLMLNVFDGSPGRELLLAAAATLRRVFPSVMVRSREAEGNHVVFAFPVARSAASVRAELRRVEGSREVMGIARAVGAGIVELVPPPGTPVFTDDHAPVEAMTRRMLASLGLRREP